MDCGRWVSTHWVSGRFPMLILFPLYHKRGVSVNPRVSRLVLNIPPRGAPQGACYRTFLEVLERPITCPFLTFSWGSRRSKKDLTRAFLIAILLVGRVQYPTSRRPVRGSPSPVGAGRFPFALPRRGESQ